MIDVLVQGRAAFMGLCGPLAVKLARDRCPSHRQARVSTASMSERHGDPLENRNLQG